jgi:hypothetical protein
LVALNIGLGDANIWPKAASASLAQPSDDIDLSP